MTQAEHEAALAKVEHLLKHPPARFYQNVVAERLRSVALSKRRYRRQLLEAADRLDRAVRYVSSSLPSQQNLANALRNARLLLLKVEGPTA